MTGHGNLAKAGYDISKLPGYMPHPCFEDDGSRSSVESQLKARAEIAYIQQQQGSPAQVQQQQPVENLAQQQARMEEASAKARIKREEESVTATARLKREVRAHPVYSYLRARARCQAAS